MKVRNLLASLVCVGFSHLSYAEVSAAPDLKWYDKIKVYGLVRLAGFSSDRTPTTMGLIDKSPSANDLVIYTSSLNTEATLSHGFSTLMMLSYAQTSPAFLRSPAGGGNVLFVNNMFISYSNPEKTPFYAKLGRQFVNFGGYDSSSLLESTTQLLSVFRATALSIGMRHSGFSAEAYTFRGPDRVKDGNATRVRNHGFKAEYNYANANSHFHLGAGWIQNMLGSIYTTSTVANNSTLGKNGTYTQTVPALDLSADFHVASIDAAAKYIGGMRESTATDIPYTTDGGTTLKGARPAAWSFNVGYTEKSCRSRLGVGYQGTAEAVALGKVPGSSLNETKGIYGSLYAIGMPKSRYYANYSFPLTKEAGLRFEYARDIAYGTAEGGTGQQASIITSEIVVKF